MLDGPEIIFFLSSVVNSSLEQPSIQGSIVEPQIFLLQLERWQLGTNASALYSGSGVPSNSNGANGDYYFRTDTPAVATQRIYVRSAGVWVGII